MSARFRRREAPALLFSATTSLGGTISRNRASARVISGACNAGTTTPGHPQICASSSWRGTQETASSSQRAPQYMATMSFCVSTTATRPWYLPSRLSVRPSADVTRSDAQ
eukprot:11038882-Lingulodinium_polyedra.AAC.1